MRALEAKNFLVEQTAEQAALENVPLSDLEKRMMYFTETGECPEDPITLNDAFEAEYDTLVYEKKISRLMARAYSRIKRDNPKKLRLWNDAFGVLGKGDHYLLLFWRQNALRRSPQMWRTYVLVTLAGVSFYLLAFVFFGNRGRMRRGEPAPIDKYIPPLSPLVQHTLQFLFLLAFLLAVFPQFFSKLLALLRGFLQSASLAKRQK
jgi:hypothetical protein